MNTESSLPKIPPISFWLLPAEPDLQLLTALINQLADKYNAPRFVPHVTLLVSHLAEDESATQLLESAVKGISPPNLEILGLGHDPDRFKSVFIRLNSEPILPLNAALRASCRYSADYQLHAHLSLLYLQLPFVEKLSLISDLQLSQSRLYFDSVAAVRPGYGQRSFDDVEQWRFAAQVKLTDK